MFAWGVWGHQHISHAAVLELPSEMRLFFYNHIDFITEESVVPDIRKYTMKDKAEFARHYIDIEAFENTPIDELPKTPEEAYRKYDSLTLQKYGLLPWYIQEMMQKLTKAFKAKNKTEILFLAADLSHYLADANMPLHTSLNHNGQLTNQIGIHGFWESQLPEMFGDAYNFKVAPANYISDITTETWSIIKHSHSLADTLLLADRQLKNSFNKNQIYKQDSLGHSLKNWYGDPIFSYAYAKAYNDALNGMVENQLRHAIQDIANYWYTAWFNAGKPDLNDIDSPELTKANHKKYKKEMKLLKQGKLFGFKSQNEY
ncbi:MAG: zinc dependent phospholipase C family protein [Ferruginibacter sp.]